jgi:hypothetical protein
MVEARIQAHFTDEEKAVSLYGGFQGLYFIIEVRGGQEVLLPGYAGPGHEKMKGGGQEGDDDVCVSDQGIPLHLIVNPEDGGPGMGCIAYFRLCEGKVAVRHDQLPIPGCCCPDQVLDEAGGRFTGAEQEDVFTHIHNYMVNNMDIV